MLKKCKIFLILTNNVNNPKLDLIFAGRYVILIWVIFVIDELKIKKELKTEYFGQNIVCRESVDSTNLLAKRNSELDEGTLFVADTQTNGKGRLGREWHSESGDGIYMSILLKPDISPEDIPKITLLCGIAVSRIIENSKIKYPNDILLNSKKVCGILCEISYTQKNQPIVVCGIGINVNNKNFHSELSQKATSLFLETKKEHSREEIIRNLLIEFEVMYIDFLKNGIASFMNEYRKKCINIGTDVKAFLNGKEIQGKCTTITNDGAIVIETPEKTYKINTGEISVRGIYGYV